MDNEDKVMLHSRDSSVLENLELKRGPCTPRFEGTKGQAGRIQPVLLERNCRTFSAFVTGRIWKQDGTQ